MHLKLSSTIFFNLDRSKILSFGNGLKLVKSEIVWIVKEIYPIFVINTDLLTG